MLFPHGEQVTRLRGSLVVDPYSGELTGRDWSTPATLVIENCGIFLGGSIEPLRDARQSVESDFDVLAPFGSDVTAADRVIIRGLACQVEGRPFDVHHPMTGWEPGMIFSAKVVEG